MHRADVLVIGPLDPLLPRPVRVRLSVAVAVAITMILLCAVLILAATVTLQTTLLPMSSSVFASVGGVLPLTTPGHDPRPYDVSVQVVSRPAGATVLLNNRELGRTPATVSVAREDLLVLRRDGFLDAFVRASGPSLEVPLWRAQPDVRLLRPPVPGVSIRSADFLTDGRVAFAVEVPPNRERQAWAYDPAAARADRLGRVDVPGAAPSGVTIALDAIHTAAIVHLDGLDGAAADQLTLDGPDGPRQPLSSLSVGERLLDTSWSPSSDGVLVLSGRQIIGGTRFHLRFVGTEGQVRDVAELPGEPVAGSWVWAPKGGSVAFLVRTTTMALVALDLATGEMRYLDDLRVDALPSSGAVAPAAWEASGDLLYAGTAGSYGSSGTSGPVLFRVAPRRTDAHRIGDVEPVWAPIVRDDGVVLTLARGENDVLVLRPVDQNGHALAEQRLGVQVSGAFAARWDLVHRQLLIVRGTSAGGVDVLLLRFGTDATPATGPGAGAVELLP